MNNVLLPNLIIAGVHKAATTSLFTYLAVHPDIYGPGKKEIHYFTPLRFGNDIQDVEEYKKFFIGRKDERYALDGSPSYIYGGQVLRQAMRRVLPDHKIIVILRNPVSRFLSNYNYLRAKLLIDTNEGIDMFVEKCIQASKMPLIDTDYSRAIVEGKYFDFIPEWFDEYGSDNFKIIFFEDFIVNPQTIMCDLANWLDIDSTPFQNMKYTIENKTSFVRNKILHGYVLKLNDALEDVLRKNHKLKVWLRDVYYKINRDNKQNQAPVEQNTINEIIAPLYIDSNKKLKKYLCDKGVGQLPNWVCGKQ